MIDKTDTTNDVNKQNKHNLLFFPNKISKKTLSLLRENSSNYNPNDDLSFNFNINEYKKHIEALSDEELINESSHLTKEIDSSSGAADINIPSNTNDDRTILMANLVLEELSKRIIK